MPQTFDYDSYDLQPTNKPSATRWISEDAQRLPEKIERLIGARGPAVIGKLGDKETYTLKGVRWTNKPAPSGDSSHNSLTRNLEVVWEVKKNAAGIRSTSEIALPIKGVPYPSAKGCYLYGSNEYLITTELKQKEGVFPVSTEERKNGGRNPHILWKTPNAVFLQGNDELHVQLFGKFGNPNGGIATVPKRLWKQFDEVLKSFRSQSGSLTAQRNTPRDNELASILSKVVGATGGENRNFAIFKWLDSIASERVPEGSWEKRWDSLSTDYGKTVCEIGAENAWSLKTALKAQKTLETLPETEFLEPGHIGRMKLETGSDKLADSISNQIFDCIRQAQTHYHEDRQKNISLQISWLRQNWQRNLERDLNNPRLGKTINEEPTPQSLAQKANAVKKSFALIGDSEEISDLERQWNPSMQGFIAPQTAESSNVGRDHWLCMGARRNELGEPLKPVVLRNSDSNQTVWMNSEDYENLERSLAKEGKGVLLGRPDQFKEDQVPLRIGGKLVNTAAKEAAPAYLDFSVEDTLPFHLAIAERVSQIDASRLPMLHAGINNARTPEGAEKPRGASETITKAAEAIANSGSLAASPVDGEVISSKLVNGIRVISIRDDAGDTHRLNLPAPKANSFSQLLGSHPYVKEGDRIRKGEIVAGPSHPAYSSQMKGRLVTDSLDLHAGINMEGVILPTGIEDQMTISEHVKRSGRMDETTVEAESTERQGYPIHVKALQPGTIIRPGDVLAYQIVDGKTVPILAGKNQGGVLQKVSFLQDPENPLGNSNEIVLEGETEARPDPRQFASMEFKDALRDFNDLKTKIDPNYVQDLSNKGIDILQCVREVTYEINGDPRITTLEELSKTDSPALRELIDASLDSNAELKFDKEASYLSERLHYANRRCRAHAELCSEHVAAFECPTMANQVLFEISRTSKPQTGSKLSDTSGTKGVLNVSAHLPPIKTASGRYKPAEIAFASLAVLARGSLSRYYNTSSKPEELRLQKSYAIRSDGKVQAVDVESIDVYEFVQKANPDRGNKHFANPPKQGRNYLGANSEGVKVSNEGRVLGASMKAFIDSNSVDFSPAQFPLEKFADRLSAKLERVPTLDPQPAIGPEI